MAIIAVLAALLLPALRGAKEAALKVACGSNLRQMYTAFILYTADNAGSPPRLPQNTLETASLSTWWDTSGFPWPSFLDPYCPAPIWAVHDNAFSFPAGHANYLGGPTAYACPKLPKNGWAPFRLTVPSSLTAAGNYTYNTFLSQCDGWVANVPALQNLGMIRRPRAQIWVFMDPVDRTLTPGSNPPQATYFGTRGANLAQQFLPHGRGSLTNGVINVMMLDGHLESFTRNAYVAGVTNRPQTTPMDGWW